jgi:integrase
LASASRFRATGAATCLPDHSEGRPRVDDRSRKEHLTEAEVERLMEVAKGNRHGHRDVTMVLVAYRHGLRASELTDLRWGRAG